MHYYYKCINITFSQNKYRYLLWYVATSYSSLEHDLMVQIINYDNNLILMQVFYSFTENPCLKMGNPNMPSSWCDGCPGNCFSELLIISTSRMWQGQGFHVLIAWLVLQLKTVPFTRAGSLTNLWSLRGVTCQRWAHCVHFVSRGQQIEKVHCRKAQCKGTSKFKVKASGTEDLRV